MTLCRAALWTPCLFVLASACNNPSLVMPPAAAGAGGAAGLGAPVQPIAAGTSSQAGAPAMSSPSAAGSGGTATTTPPGPSGEAGAAGSSAVAGAAAGSGGGVAGSGAGASAAGAAGSGVDPSPDAGPADADPVDPIGDLIDGLFKDPFGTPNPPSAPLSCEDLFCFDVVDCAILHPDEAATCNFTDCVDFVCAH